MTLNEIRHKVVNDPILHDAWEMALPLVREFLMAEQQRNAEEDSGSSLEEMGRYVRFTNRVSKSITNLVPPKKHLPKKPLPTRPKLHNPPTF